MGIEACFAGHWDVPTIMVQGDEMACREAEALFPGVVTAAAKRAETTDLCSGLDPTSARRLRAEKVAEVIHKTEHGQIKPYKPTLPMTITIRSKTIQYAEDASKKPGV